MNWKSILIATLLGAVAMFFLGWIIWGFGLMSIQQSHTIQYDGLTPDYPNMVYMAISMIFTALLYAIIYNRWAGIKTFRTGAIAGAIITALSGLGYGFMMLASFNLIDFTVVLTDLVGNLIWGGLAGGVIGWALGKFE